MMKWVSILTLLLVASVLVWGVRNSRAATETPQYEVLFEEGKLEIREYPELRMATTITKGSEENGSFTTLFRFIDGGNASEAKIAMTSPVLMEEGGEQTTMSFIVPEATVAEGVPEPSSEKVNLRVLGASRMVALRFSRKGKQETDEKAALASLRECLTEKGLEVEGAPLFAYYDPPWTPFFMRRNEVMLRLAASQELTGLGNAK